MDEEHIDELKKPGQYLAYEREKKGLTAEDIAEKLHLSPHIIHGIEKEMHDKLPELVYVRGYIRAYCRLLHIDPVPVLDMYTANLPQETDQFLEDLSSNSPINERQQKHIIFWGSVAVASIFLVLVMSWWQEPKDILISEPFVSQEEVAPASMGEPSVSQEDVFPISEREPSVLQEDVPPISENEPSVLQEDVPPISESEPPVLQEDVPPTSAGEPPVSQEDVPPTSAGEPPVSQEDAAEQSEASDISPQQEAAQSSTDIEIINVPNDRIPPAVSNTESDTELNDERFNTINDTLQPVTLVVMSSGESWARVTDGSGDIFIHRILSEGYNKIFMVNLPLKFEFGNAHQVSLMIDGEDYDLSSYIRSNKVAVFEVTELP